MCYVRIFFLHFQEAVDKKEKYCVWFLIPFVNISILLLFGRGAFAEKGNFIKDGFLSLVSSYYFLFVVASSFSDVHIEANVARRDVQ